MVEVGLAVTDEPVVALNPVAGDHEYVVAPFAVNVADCPRQKLTFGETVTTGAGLTVTVTCVEPVHPFRSPMTVYVVVLVGLAVTEVPDELLNVAAGLQIYVLAPLAVSVVDCPLQIVAGATVMFGWLAIVTVTCAVAVHPSELPVTVYVIVEAGFAVTLAPVVALRFVAGLHA